MLEFNSHTIILIKVFQNFRNIVHHKVQVGTKCLPSQHKSNTCYKWYDTLVGFWKAHAVKLYYAMCSEFGVVQHVTQNCFFLNYGIE
jgi:hypothetical protein